MDAPQPLTSDAAAGTSAAPPATSGRGAQSKRWVFTAQVGGDGQPAATWEPTWSPDHMSYMVFGRETAPSTGQRHIQGYVRCKTTRRAVGVMHLLGLNMHVEPAKGNEAQNREYCIKEGNFTEHGVFDGNAGKQGHRTDLSNVVILVQEGASLRRIAQECPEQVIKHGAGIQALINLTREAPAMRDIHVTVLWGETGVGKTHRVRVMFPEAYCANFKDKNTWDSYTDQKVVLIDEFDPSTISIQELNKILDKWRHQLTCRYQNKEAFWTSVYICTNLNPSEWYAGMYANPLVKSLQRRLAEPVGRVFEVVSQDQEIPLTWWTTIVPATPSDQPRSSPTISISSPRILAAQTPSRSTTPIVFDRRNEDDNPTPLKRLRRGTASVGVRIVDQDSGMQQAVQGLVHSAAGTGNIDDPFLV